MPRNVWYVVVTLRILPDCATTCQAPQSSLFRRGSDTPLDTVRDRRAQCKYHSKGGCYDTRTHAGPAHIAGSTHITAIVKKALHARVERR